MMRSRSNWTTLIPIALAASCVLSRDGGYEGPSFAGNPPSGGPCTSLEDCPGDDDPLCGQRACIEGLCGGNFVTQGTECAPGKRCDGLGNCASCLSSQDCASGTCTDRTQVGGEVCRDGECQPVPEPLSCAPYVCDSGTHCHTSCSEDDHCIEAHFCTGGGHCLPKGELGDPCSDGGDCVSGFCADEVCCDSACDKACEECSAAGACAPIPALQDPGSECVPPLECSGTPACATCGLTPTPPNASPPGTCPPECDECQGSTCVIRCLGNECVSPTPEVICPEGWDCDVHCTGNNSCETVAIRCPEAYRCNVDCTNNGIAAGNNRCKDAVVDCSATGECNVLCGGTNACKDLTIACGSNTCSVACLADGDPLHRTGCPNNCNNCSPAGICTLN